MLQPPSSPEPGKRKTQRRNQKIRTRRSTTHLVLQPQEAGPPALDERVVGGDDGDDVDALGLELVDLLQERRQVVHVAGRLHIRAWISDNSVQDVRHGRSRVGGRTHGERAGDGDEDDLLALPLVRAQLDRCLSDEIERTKSIAPRLNVEEGERY